MTNSEVVRRLIINLDNTSCWYVDREVGSLIVVAEGVSSHHPVPDEIIIVSNGIAILSYTPDVGGDELMDSFGPNLKKQLKSE